MNAAMRGIRDRRVIAGREEFARRASRVDPDAGEPDPPAAA
jgi:hypothetical protein